MKKWISYALTLCMLASIMTAAPVLKQSIAVTTQVEQIPFQFPSAYQTTLFESSFENGTGNYVDRTVKESYEGKASPTVEVLDYAFDGTTTTKYLTSYANDGSCYVQVKLVSPITLSTYLIASANDVPERDPAVWDVYGSADGTNWTKIDSQSGVTFASRFESKVFTVATPGQYQYYKWVVSQTKDTTSPYLQYSELMLNPVNLSADSTPVAGSVYGSLQGLSNMGVNTATGGSHGGGSLQVTATHPQNVNGNGYILLYDNVNVAIGDNTKLSYCIKPVSASGYDTAYPGHYMAIDLVCTDGTRLSTTDTLEQNGHLLTPYDQGATRTLVTDNWNYIKADLTALKGKTVQKVLVGYDRRQNTTGKTLSAIAYFDGLHLYDEEPEPIVSKTQYVKTTRGSYFDGSNIFRGTSFPGICYPNGMMKVTPSTMDGYRIMYSYMDPAINGFTITHQSSIHLLDYNRFTFMPSVILNANDANETNTSANVRKATFSHDNELDRADYYAVQFDDGTAASGVKTEITTTDHTLSARFTFRGGDANHTIIFDSKGAETTDASALQFLDNGAFNATVKNGNETFTNGFTEMYLYGRFSEVPVSTKIVHTGSATGAASFSSNTNQVVLEIGQSYISHDQARRNLEMEIPVAGNFDTTRQVATAAWEDIFDLIDIEGATRDQLVSVYSGLYRLYSYPTNHAENVGTVEAPVIKHMSPYTKTVTDGPMYTSNGFWDTYRTAWPAYTLLTPTKAGDLLDGILQHYKESGQLARWLNPAGVPSMLGSNSDAIFADAAVKGVDFDVDTAYRTVIANAATVESGSGSTRPNSLSLYSGYVHSGLGTSVSWQLENNLCDYAAARFAQWMGDDDYAAYLQNRSLGYTYLMEPQSKFFISRAADGTFTASGSNLDPYLWNPNVYGHIESSAWGMVFSVPHDPEGLAALFGGKQAMADKLDQMMSANPECTTAIGMQHEMFEGREVKMGQYWHSNQPAHGNLFMYNYADQPYKTQKYTREVLDRLYVGSDFGQGYMGDEDNGEQSAWYLFAALGFYPLSLGSGDYTITAPLFDKVTLHLESGDVEIIAHNNSKENVYIQSMTVDGVAHNSTDLSHEALTRAKKIEFTMGATPSDWGVDSGPARASSTVGADPVVMEDLGGISASPAVLFDGVCNNTSYTTVTQPVDVRFASPRVVKMLTVSCIDTSTAPKGVTVQGSHTGADGSWVTIKQKNLNYSIIFQVMPISLDNDTAYSHYRIVFNTHCDVGEIELLGYKNQEFTCTMDQLEDLNQTAQVLMQEHVSVKKDAAVQVAYKDGLRGVENGLISEYNAGVLYKRLEQALLTHVTSAELQAAMTPFSAFSEWTDLSDAIYHLGVANATADDPYYPHYHYVAQEFQAPTDKMYGAQVGLNLTGGSAVVHLEVRKEVNGTALLTREISIESQGDGAAWYTLEFAQPLTVTPGETYYLVYYLSEKAAGNLCIVHGSIMGVNDAKHPGYVWAMSSGGTVNFNDNQRYIAFAFKVLTQPQSPQELYGDVDGNGTISAADALEILKSVVGNVTLTESQRVRADVDGNGEVQASDALFVLRKVVNKIDRFPIEE